ncbi:MAG TPA: hypothetical protein VF627_06195, partial [Abditibacterium sp.]
MSASGLMWLGVGCNTFSGPTASPPPKTVKTVASNVSSKSKVGVSKMARSQVLKIAKQTAIRNGYKLKDYLEPTTTFDPKDKKWIVILDHKLPAFPGSRSLVFVNDQNGK